jgi:hypothetical protein
VKTPFQTHQTAGLYKGADLIDYVITRIKVTMEEQIDTSSSRVRRAFADVIAGYQGCVAEFNDANTTEERKQGLRARFPDENLEDSLKKLSFSFYVSTPQSSK